MCRWFMRYSGGTTRLKRTNRIERTVRRTVRRTTTRGSAYRSIVDLFYRDNGLFEQTMNSQSKEIKNNMDGFGIAAVVGRDLHQYRSMQIPRNDPNVKSWIRLLDRASPSVVVGHIRANSFPGQLSHLGHTHPMCHHTPKFTCMVTVNGLIKYPDLNQGETDTQRFARGIFKTIEQATVGGRNVPFNLESEMTDILEKIKYDFRMTLAIVLIRNNRTNGANGANITPSYYVARATNGSMDPQTLYHHKDMKLYASETLFASKGWKSVPIQRFPRR